MTIMSYKKAKSIIESGDLNSEFYGPSSDSEITAIEQCASYIFPPAYRNFLLDFGCGNVCSEEFYGYAGPKARNVVPNGLWLNADMRENGALGPQYFVIQSCGDGTWIALDSSCVEENGEYQVVRLSVDLSKIEVIEKDFGDFFLGRIIALGK